MKRLLKRTASVLGIVTALLLVAAAGLTKAHMYRVYGGRVERVDPAPFQTSPERIAIRNATVLAPDGEAMLEGRTVVVEDGRIVSVAAGADVPEGATVIDGTGRFLVPGLVDAHVHLRQQPNDLLAYLANGVTHIRDLAGSAGDLRLRRELEEGRPGPRLSVATAQLYTSGRLDGWFRDFTRSSRNVRYGGSAEDVVRTIESEGYDAIKLYDNIDPVRYRAITAAARAAGIHTVGHLPIDFDLEDLATMDQRELAHIEEIVKKLLDEFGPFFAGGGGEAFLTMVEERTPGIVDDLLAGGVAVNTTLWLMDTLESQATDLRNGLRTLPLEYANPAMVEGSEYIGLGWLPGRNRFELPPDADAEQRARSDAFFRARVEAQRILLREMVARGVDITAGTDAATEFMVPGFSLHDELRSLVRAGLTPAQALRSATATPAEIMRSEAGVIEPGRRADLVLLNANPLEDIANTATVEVVVVGGRLYDRDRLDAMLDAVRQANDNSRRWDLSEYR
jgi:hypothetical protein